jgi:hypothetical protein
VLVAVRGLQPLVAPVAGHGQRPLVGPAVAHGQRRLAPVACVVVAAARP